MITIRTSMTKPVNIGIEAQFFNNLNQIIEPLLRAGFGFPCFSPAGTILLETKGRKSGQKITLPLLATQIGNLLLVSTVRNRSQWLKNIEASPQVTYWLRGLAVEARGYVFTSKTERDNKDLPEKVAILANAIMPQSRLFGINFVILVPRQP